MNHRLALLILCTAASAVPTAHAASILTENFEDGALDPRMSISSVGTFNAAPGIQSFSGIEGNKAFGFGLSNNRNNSYDSFATTLTITFSVPTFVSTVSFSEMEVFDNWGSYGLVYIDGVQVDLPTIDVFGRGSFGRAPWNDRTADTAPRFHELAVHANLSKIQFRVSDITDLSEVYIDNITVSAVPEPSEALMLGLGTVGVFAIARRRQTKLSE